MVEALAENMKEILPQFFFYQNIAAVGATKESMLEGWWPEEA